VAAAIPGIHPLSVSISDSAAVTDVFYPSYDHGRGERAERGFTNPFFATTAKNRYSFRQAHTCLSRHGYTEFPDSTVLLSPFPARTSSRIYDHIS
jgi:hypothetical protein